MTWKQSSLYINTDGRSAIEITSMVDRQIRDARLNVGIAHLFLKHTSASLMLSENADPTVLRDLETVMQRLGPDGDPEYLHNYEGDDDMAAHVRSVLTTNDLSIPISQGRTNLGTWQGIFIYEHRFLPHRRELIITLNGE